MTLNTDKLSYSIGQVAEIAGVAQSTLRYWETVIGALKPQKTTGGSRRYNKETIELVLLVKNLLHDQGHTIKGTNLYLAKNKNRYVEDSPRDFSEVSLKKNTGAKISVEVTTKDFQYIHDELIKIDKLLE